MPTSSRNLGVPKGFYETTENYFNLHKGEKVNLRFERLQPAHIIQRVLPKTDSPHIHWKFDKSLQYESPETFSIIIPDGRVVGKSGTVISHDDKMLLDVSMKFGIGRSAEKAKYHPIFSSFRLPKVTTIEGKALVLATASSDNFYNWFMESIPRLEIILATQSFSIDKVDKFLVSKGGTIISESLKLIGVPQEKILMLGDTDHIQANELAVPSLVGDPCDPPEWVCKHLRKRFLQHAITTEPISRVYISREKTRTRIILNEEEVVNTLFRYGFKRIFLEDYDLPSQISLLSQADVVVAAHGAGLTNLVWCRENTKVIEIFSPNYLNLCFWGIANHVKLDYHYLLGDGDQPPEYSDPYLIYDNILVDTNRLESLLRKVLSDNHR